MQSQDSDYQNSSIQETAGKKAWHPLRLTILPVPNSTLGKGKGLHKHAHAHISRSYPSGR